MSLEPSDIIRGRYMPRLEQVKTEDLLGIIERLKAEAACLRRVLQALYDDWTGKYSNEQFVERYGLTDATDEGIDNWLLGEIGRVLDNVRREERENG